MKKIIGAALIILAIALGYDGVQKFQNSSASIKVLGVQIKAEDSGSKQTAYIELGLAVVALLIGYSLLKSGRSSG